MHHFFPVGGSIKYLLFLSLAVNVKLLLKTIQNTFCNLAKIKEIFTCFSKSRHVEIELVTQSSNFSQILRSSYSKFHQRFMRAFFDQNFNTLNYKAVFWVWIFLAPKYRQNVRKMLMKLTTRKNYNFLIQIVDLKIIPLFECDIIWLPCKC
jgi:hypothetical protein